MIRATPHIEINENEIELAFIRATGPGGQHVNKAATAVQLRFDIQNASSLPDDVRKRMLRFSDRRITAEGILVILARRFRSQEQNRQDAIQRLVALIRKATLKPKRRLKTRPPLASKKRRLESKRRLAVLKAQRRPVPHFDD